ncbi:MAG: hypothetical protein ACRDON_00430, partial [Gaiellaceae bacterium]
MSIMLASTDDFKPQEEFVLEDWIPLELGPIDLSVNKAVVYLWVGSPLTMVIGILFMRVRLRLTPDRRQTVGEQIYDIAQTQIAE